MSRTDTIAMLSELVEKRLKNQTAFGASEVCTKELCADLVMGKMVPERVDAILTPDSTGSKLIRGHVQAQHPS